MPSAAYCRSCWGCTQLAVSAECQLTYDAYDIAGECCRQLRHLEFDNVNKNSSLANDIRLDDDYQRPYINTIFINW